MHLYEDTLFVLKIHVHISRYGGIITRDLLASDGECKREERYVIHGASNWSSWWGQRFNRAINEECRFSGLSPLPKFKDDGFYRYYDDAELVLESVVKLFKWMRTDALKLNKKQLKEIESKWSPILNRQITHDDWVKTKASMNGMPVKKRSELSESVRDLVDRRDYLEHH